MFLQIRHGRDTKDETVNILIVLKTQFF